MMSGAMRLLILNTAAAATTTADWTNSSPSAVTPTVGSELLTNGGFSAWTGDDPDGWTVTETAPDPEVSEVGTGEGHGGTGSGMCNLYATGAAAIIAQNVGSNHNWYQVSITVDTVVSGNLQTKSWPTNITFSTSQDFTHRRTGSFTIQRNATPTDVTIDDVSYKLLSDTTTAEASAIVASGWGYAHWHVVSNRQAGLDLVHTSSGDLIRLYIDHVANKVWLGKYISSSWTWITSSSITYSDTKALGYFFNPTTNTLTVAYDTPANMETWGSTEATWDSNKLFANATLSDANLASIDALHLFSTDSTNSPQVVRFKEV